MEKKEEMEKEEEEEGGRHDGHKTSNQIRTAAYACPPPLPPPRPRLSVVRPSVRLSGFGPFSHPFPLLPLRSSRPPCVITRCGAEPADRPRGGRAGKIIGDLVYYITGSGGSGGREGGRRRESERASGRARYGRDAEGGGGGGEGRPMFTPSEGSGTNLPQRHDSDEHTNNPKRGSFCCLL